MASLKVAVRVRPFHQREIDMNAKLIVQMDGKQTKLLKPIRIGSSGRDLSASSSSSAADSNNFTFDYSYWSFDKKDTNFISQNQVYDDLGTDVINCAFQGYNACVLAYGQTGSGKSYTMMGGNTTADELGLTPRICEAMFARMQLDKESISGYKTTVSYLEIYNEKVRDLLATATTNNTGHSLRVREHRTHGPYVEELSQHSVANYAEIQQCINRGNQLRTTASTLMNDTSSRSHAIFTITFVKAGFLEDNMPSETVSKIHLVDLAGSERCDATGATGQRLKEGAHINKSLVTLGSVISALAEQSQQSLTVSTNGNKRNIYIPYRDSILTWLLKDSLGGNSKTIMIAAISPADCNYGETLSTLRYANRAKNIINKPTINEDSNVKLIRELRDEIRKLKSMLIGGGNSGSSSEKMFEDLLKKEAQEKMLTEEWTERWHETHAILREQKALGLRMSGVGVVLDSESPHLIGIHDSISTGVTLYSLKEGDTLIGTADASSPPQDIVLTGIGINEQHCCIRLENGIATIYPHNNAQCWLNAFLIDEPTKIIQGDILLLGRTNMFRYNNPAEAAKLRKDGTTKSSRYNLSRLSLIAASRENLTVGGNSSFFSCTSDDDLHHQQMDNSMKRDRLGFANELNVNLEMKVEHRKILETIEEALDKLNTERIQIHDQYHSKVNALSIELKTLQQQSNVNETEVFNCQKRHLTARKEMLLWDKLCEKSKCDIIVKQMSSLQMQLEFQRKNLYETLRHELLNLMSSGIVDFQSLQSIEECDDEDISICLQKQFAIIDKLIKTEQDMLPESIHKDRENIKMIQKNLDSKESLLSTTSLELIELDAEMVRIESEEQQLLNDQLRANEKLNNNPMPQITVNERTIQSDTDDNYYSTYQSNDNLSMDHTNGNASSVQSKRTSTPNHNSNESQRNHFIESEEECTSSSSVDPIDHLDEQETPSSLNRVCAMHKLRKKIAILKAQIMKNLELNCDKVILDEKISKLQDYQRKYVNLEKRIQSASDGILTTDDLECCLTDREIGFDTTSSDESQLCQLGLGYNEPSYNSQSILERNMNENEYFVSIPSFVVRGAGKQTHYEYEIRITLPTDKWILLRRYRRFRELYLSMKNSYGSEVASIPFPQRELFLSNTEMVARKRRRQLENYLRRLLVVCSKIPNSPIYEDGSSGITLTKDTLIALSPFFQKGLFECGKHGTG